MVVTPGVSKRRETTTNYKKYCISLVTYPVLQTTEKRRKLELYSRKLKLPHPQNPFGIPQLSKGYECAALLYY